MSYVDTHLLNGEMVTYRTRLHWKVFLAPILATVFLFIPFALTTLATEAKVWTLLPILLAVLSIGGAYLKQQTSEFAVTNKRIIIKVGVLSTRSLELLLSKVEGIAVNQGMLGKMLGYGAIVVTGTGGSKEPFADIEKPFDFRHAVQSVTDTQGRTA